MRRFQLPSKLLLLRETMLRRFNVRKEIGLGFFNGREQYDRFVEPGRGVIEFDGSNIYWVVDGQRLMSETINEAISIWLEMGNIEEIPAEEPDDNSRA
jgi:hypothetical protein